MSTPDFVEAHLDAIHITGTKAEALSDANKPATLKKFDVPDTTELRELKYLNNPQGLTQYSPGFRTMKGTLEMDLERDSPIIALLRQRYLERKPVFIHCIEDAEAATGAQGIGYEAVLGSFPATREAGALRSISVELGVNGFWLI
ncbi:hypothetical protein [Archangium primigenium]|uniref:hypothetical protein n=1 Tax=[Archangium] primigenium TaxID=2792470 RepID=UPI00195B8B54|nr:hypothetical protein [Archangium primigenium]MBM7117638.1 hypothetical protein [Archangium primigenium]